MSLTSVAVEAEILGVKVTCTPLPFSQSQPMLPDVMEFMAVATKAVGILINSGKLKDIASLKDPKVILAILPFLGDIGGWLQGGKLERFAPKIMALTTLVMNGERKEMSNDADRAAVFNARPDLFFPLLLTAGRVTYGRFFPDKNLVVGSGKD